MSTSLYMQCETHDPPIVSDCMGQHLYDLDHIREDWSNIHTINAGHEVGLSLEGDYYGQGYNRHFMIQHRRCEVVMVDEYGKYHDLAIPPGGEQ